MQESELLDGRSTDETNETLAPPVTRRLVRRSGSGSGAGVRDCPWWCMNVLHEHVAAGDSAWSRGPDETNRVQHETTPTGRCGAWRVLEVAPTAPTQKVDQKRSP